MLELIAVSTHLSLNLGLTNPVTKLPPDSTAATATLALTNQYLPGLSLELDYKHPVNLPLFSSTVDNLAVKVKFKVPLF